MAEQGCLTERLDGKAATLEGVACERRLKRCATDTATGNRPWQTERLWRARVSHPGAEGSPAILFVAQVMALRAEGSARTLLPAQGPQVSPMASVRLRLPHPEAVGQRLIWHSHASKSTVRRAASGTFFVRQSLLETLNIDSETLNHVQDGECRDRYGKKRTEKQHRRQAT